MRGARWSVDCEDRATAVLLGDGVGAVVLEVGQEPGIISSHLHTDGAYADLLHIPGGVGGDPDGSRYLKMQGTELFKVAVTTLCSNILVPHQANIRIIQAVARKLALPPDRVVITIDEHANTKASGVVLPGAPCCWCTEPAGFSRKVLSANERK